MPAAARCEISGPGKNANARSGDKGGDP
jgi:hypothetical protein